MILLGSLVQVKGFGFALVSSRKRWMASLSSWRERNTPRLRRFLTQDLARLFRSTAEAFVRRICGAGGGTSLIRGSSRMTLLRLGLPQSRWRESKAHSGDEGSPALSHPQRRIPRRG